MWRLVAVLLVGFLVLAVVGAVVEGLLWLLVAGVAAFLVTTFIAWSRTRRF